MGFSLAGGWPKCPADALEEPHPNTHVAKATSFNCVRASLLYSPSALRILCCDLFNDFSSYMFFVMAEVLGEVITLV